MGGRHGTLEARSDYGDDAGVAVEEHLREQVATEGDLGESDALVLGFQVVFGARGVQDVDVVLRGAGIGPVDCHAQAVLPLIRRCFNLFDEAAVLGDLVELA